MSRSPDHSATVESRDVSTVQRAADSLQSLMNTGIEAPASTLSEASVGEWRIEAMNEAGEIRALLYEGWERDEANAHALRRLSAETGDPSWTTILVRDDSMEAPQ